ncbi:MAG: ADP/ATP-dependent (S)-NAD(P)H-hydrate dehydratase [Acidimicrobiales bacterium]|nr:ADP/ATP-dependent (S)-NAD(P)H-hydrate dehydratase [Acidimicrobiales bacterium]
MRPMQELLDAHPLPDAATGGKDDKGSVVVIGGPPVCPGAVILTATAALRIGAGRVRAAVDPAAAVAVAVAVPELAVFGWNQKASPPPELMPCLKTADVVVMGPGHTQLDDPVVRSTAERTRATLVLDAGALGSAVPVARSSRVVIAPNPTEAALLVPLDDPTDDRRDEEQLARELTAKLGQPVAVRGARTVIASDTDAWVFDDTPPGLGTPGSGDVFVGVLAGLLAGGCPPLPALAWAVQLHADAGRRLSETTPVGYLASEIAAELPYVRATSAGSPS